MSLRAKTVWIVTAAVVLLFASAPSTAWAVEVSTHVVSRIGAPELARQIMSQVRGIQIGSDSATVTVEAGGELRSVGVDVGGVAPSAPIADGDTGNLLRLAAIPFVLSSVVRLLRFLARLGSM